ncbi:MAG TPA: peptidyl-tRNA hydrolase [Euryarchaeota archaeon]|nr:peptidyl-tRNA hydrolase [archaeon BMS3Abin16]GBE55852.1 peptidyl-tRNA hydrolase [archaeon BMS3Bbin16]HDH28088.1 peptidyl-tRNA hydrolase [Euryarchaeota archaeon]HDY73899.1 peptidyl-tRNA hydrolase [Euryarchaeota archaeon]
MDFKQVIVVRSDLKMSPGKMAAQVAHASHSAAVATKKSEKKWYDAWWSEGQKKVVVKAADADEILELFRDARANSLPCYIVNDAGLTELAPGTTTTLGIGPAPNTLIDKVTGRLKLL